MSQTSIRGMLVAKEVTDELAVKRGELALLRARNEALSELAAMVRYDADPGESSVLEALDMVLNSRIGPDGLLEDGRNA